MWQSPSSPRAGTHEERREASMGKQKVSEGTWARRVTPRCRAPFPAIDATRAYTGGLPRSRRPERGAFGPAEGSSERVVVGGHATRKRSPGTTRRTGKLGASRSERSRSRKPGADRVGRIRSVGAALPSGDEETTTSGSPTDCEHGSGVARQSHRDSVPTARQRR